MEREEREPERGERGGKERPGEGAEKRREKKGGGRESKKEYKEADTVSEWEVTCEGKTKESGGEGGDWSRECPGESLTLRTHTRDKDQAKEIGMGLVQHFRARYLASLTNAPFLAYADGPTPPTLQDGFPQHPCSTPPLPPLPVILFHPVTPSLNWAPPSLNYSLGAHSSWRDSLPVSFLGKF